MMISEKKIWTRNFAFNFSTNFVWKIFDSKNNSERYYRKCTQV